MSDSKVIDPNMYERMKANYVIDALNGVNMQGMMKPSSNPPTPGDDRVILGGMPRVSCLAHPKGYDMFSCTCPDMPREDVSSKLATMATKKVMAEIDRRLRLALEQVAGKLSDRQIVRQTKVVKHFRDGKHWYVLTWKGREVFRWTDAVHKEANGMLTVTVEAY